MTKHYDLKTSLLDYKQLNYSRFINIGIINEYEIHLLENETGKVIIDQDKKLVLESL